MGLWDKMVRNRNPVLVISLRPDRFHDNPTRLMQEWPDAWNKTGIN